MNAKRSRHPFSWFVLAYTVILATFFAATCTIVYRYGALQRNLGWQYSIVGGTCYVTQVDPGGSAFGKLQKGDRVIAINGQTAFQAFTLQERKIVMIPPAGSFFITIRRNSAQFEERLDFSEKKDLRLLFPIVAILLAILIHSVVAIFVGLSRPAVKTIQLFTMAGLSLAMSQLAAALLPLEDFFGVSELRIIYLVMFLSLNPFGVALAFHFYSRFPADFPETRIWRFLKKFLYTGAAVLALCFMAFRLLMTVDPQSGSQFGSGHAETLILLRHVSDSFGLFAFIGICCVIARNYRTLHDSDNRRRIRWVAYGGVVGILPIGLYFLGSTAQQLQLPFAPSQTALTAMIPLASLALVLVPISVAYAILKNKIFDIQIVIRRGVQYLFARRFLQILVYLPIGLIVYTIRANPNRPISSLLFSNVSYIFLLIVAGAGLLFRKTLLEWLDRKFFREAYNSEKILVTLVDQIKNFNSMSEVARWVSGQLESALHPKRVLVFFKEKNRGKLILGYSSGDHSTSLEIPEHFQFVRIVEREAKSVEISSSQFEIPGSEKEWLRQHEIHLLVPMNGPEQDFYGVLMLGERKSEQPYSANDRRLLETLAGQMAVVYENLLLKDQVDEGHRVQRDVLAHLTRQRRNLVKECPACGACFDSSEEKCEHDQTELVLTLPVDRVIDGKYRLDKLIGKGGMGAVYQASDLRLSREVAIKILLGSKFGDSQARKRFTREARASARLNHPNIISIYDFGGIGEGAYLVMELLHGYTLRGALEQWSTIRPEIAAGWFDQILEGVKAAHLHGIIHRDLKPENILITRDGKNQPLVKILDFGLAKITLLDEVQSKSLTAPGTVMGTLYYMSPEQITGGEVDERTDIFALGIIAVETLTGQLPFDGKSAQEVALAILQKPVELKTDSPEAARLNSVIQKCVAKNRQNRFSTIAEMQKEFIDAIRTGPAFKPAKTAAHRGADNATQDFLS